MQVRNVRCFRSLCCPFLFLVHGFQALDAVRMLSNERKSARDPKGFSESFQLQKYLVLVAAKDIRQNLPGLVIVADHSNAAVAACPKALHSINY
jgi:hypothetical protein